jgi:cell division protein FtsZ
MTQEIPLYASSYPNPISVQRPVLKVIGMGGGGCNAIDRMIELGLRGVDFIAANTDHQSLTSNLAPTKIQLGPKTTRGLGAGGNPAVGREAAEESAREIAAALEGADMVFLTAGMGGGTGSGSIAVAARIARSLGAVTIAIVTTPFTFEMGRRQKNAIEGLKQLRRETHTLITIPNDHLLYIAPRDLPMEIAFRLADDVLRQSVQGITELITEAGFINVDFAHVRRLIQLGGGALMAIGQGKGEDKTLQAIEQALHHPLLGDIPLENAAGVIVNFTGGNDLTLAEVEFALTHLHARTGPATETVLGIITDPQLVDRVQVILVVTGLGSPTLEEAMQSVSQPAEPQLVAAELKAQPVATRSPYPPLSRPEIQPEPLPITLSPAPQPVAAHKERYELPAHFDDNSLKAAEAAPGRQGNRFDYLDVPAFLRRRTFQGK